MNESAISDKVKSSSQTTCQDLSVIREARYLEEEEDEDLNSDSNEDSDIEKSQRDLRIRAKMDEFVGKKRKKVSGRVMRRSSSGRVITDGGFGDDEGDGRENNKRHSNIVKHGSGKWCNSGKLQCKPSDTSDYVSDIGTDIIEIILF